MRNFLILIELTFAIHTTMAFASDAAQRLETKDLVENIKVRLVAVAISRTRGQNLVAKLIVLNPESRKNEEIIVRFPSHSHTPHETTLMNIIDSCTDWSLPESIYEWHRAKMNIVFSVPKDAGGYNGDSQYYDRWFVISIKALQRE